jgi:hypothetical protein
MDQNEYLKIIEDTISNGKYKDDLFVARNGHNYVIQRGVEVEVPEGIAMIIEQSEAMDNHVADLIAEAQKKAEKV